jgi:hypothetical protein
MVARSTIPPLLAVGTFIAFRFFVVDWFFVCRRRFKFWVFFNGLSADFAAAVSIVVHGHFLIAAFRDFWVFRRIVSSSRAWFSIFIIRSPIQRMTGTAMGTGYSGLVGVGLGTLPPHARGVNLRILFVESYKPHESSP